MKQNKEKLISLRNAALLLATTMSLSACGKVAECDITETHVHKYTNDDQYTRYIYSEKLKYDGYDRLDDYVIIDDDTIEMQKFIDKKGLIKIEDNLELLKQRMSEHKDYMENKYSYLYMMPIPHYISNGKTTTVHYTFMPVRHHSWTRDPNHSSLTGDTRICHYMYEAYNVVLDEKQKYTLSSSGLVDELTSEVIKQYPYIKPKYYRVVNLDTKEELDYEDMENDDVENIKTEEETEEVALNLTKKRF